MKKSTQKEQKFFTDLDRYYFHNGVHYDLYQKMGAHYIEKNGVFGVQFVLWAPNALNVCVISSFNNWQKWEHTMTKTDDSMWQLFIPNMPIGTIYKYLIKNSKGIEVAKSDPYGFMFERRPQNASIVVDTTFTWTDHDYMESKKGENFLEKPMAVYEVHLGSWKKNKSDTTTREQFYNYRDIAKELCEYVKYMGYTHIEVLGILEHPFDGSWGYQVTGYFAPTSRYGTLQDFKYFVDTMHANGIGVILDWVPAHFPKDEFGLFEFDGTPLYEYADKTRSDYPQWGTKAFDLSKKEVCNFLIASAFYFVKECHIDALRSDAVAAMLYRSFGREKWTLNEEGNDFNLESFAFFRHLNSVLRSRTDAYIIAEDSSILAGVTSPTKNNGLGFGLKWNMGWMNDTIRYYNKESIYRQYHHELITNTFNYAFNENYILVLSHDEVVHGKGTMFNKMSGNHLDKIGSLKTVYTMMMGHPGKKLLFMGQDFGQEAEWDYNGELQWHLTQDSGHRDIMDAFRRLLNIYTTHPVLYNDTGKTNVFEWLDSNDRNRNLFSFIRRNPWNYNNALIFVCNFAPCFWNDVTLGVPLDGKYHRIFTTYDETQECDIIASENDREGRKYKITLNIKPYESMIIQVPLVEKTEEEHALERAVRARIRAEHDAHKSHSHHIPTIDVNDATPKKSSKKSTTKKSSKK